MRGFPVAVGIVAFTFASACGSGGGGGGSGGFPTLAGSLPFYNAALDLDSDTEIPSFMGSPGTFPGTAWDFYFANNGSRPVHAVLFQNGGNSVEIAHLLGRTFDSVTEADVATATFTTGLVDEPFDATRVVLVRTDLGAVYKVGNASEDATTVFFDYELLIP
jgi:hypothetical protein